MFVYAILSLFALSVASNILGTEYVVYPRDRIEQIANSMITIDLTNLLPGDGKVQTYTSAERGIPEFWLVEADESQVSSIQSFPKVKEILANTIMTKDCRTSELTPSFPLIGPAPSKPTTTPRPAPPSRSILLQSDAPQDLSLVSWSLTKPLPWRLPGYVYDPTFGRDTYLYLIDNGLNISPPPKGRGFPEFRYVEWHSGYSVDTRPIDNSTNGHATCVASKAAGRRNGVSKNTCIVVLKAGSTVADTTWAFAKALDDVIEKGRQGKAVVVFPRTSVQQFEPGSGLPDNWASIKDLMRELFEQDVVVVTCAGSNTSSRSAAINTFPALWAASDLPLVVAGAVTAGGDYARFSSGRTGDSAEIIWAPGDKVRCTRGEFDPNAAEPIERRASGTSFSAGMVAGLAAYFLGRSENPGHVAADMVRRLSTTASWPISPRSRPDVIWNGQDGSNYRCPGGLSLELETEGNNTGVNASY